jgi:endonuclease/exonuclease/phosphatase (EEP) superfamily protein YafD
VTVDRPGLSLRVLDYLFFRTGKDRRAHYRQVENRYGSDHYPLVGWVE